MTPKQKKLVEDHAYLVPALVRHYNAPSPWSREDLVSAGYEALCWAAERWDPTREARFSTFANRRITGAFRDEIRKLGWGTRSSPDQYYYLTEDDEVLNASMRYQDEYEFDRDDPEQFVKDLIQTLPEPHRTVMQMRMAGHRGDVISMEVGVSPSRISQLAAAALRRMQSEVAA